MEDFSAQTIVRTFLGSGNIRTEVLWRNARCVELAQVQRML